MGDPGRSQPPRDRPSQAWKTDQGKEQADGQPDLSHGHPRARTSGSAAAGTAIPAALGPGPPLVSPALLSQGQWARAPTGVATLWESRLSHWLQVQGQEQRSQTVPARVICLVSGCKESCESKLLAFQVLVCPLWWPSET